MAAAATAAAATAAAARAAAAMVAAVSAAALAAAPVAAATVAAAWAAAATVAAARRGWRRRRRRRRRRWRGRRESPAAAVPSAARAAPGGGGGAKHTSTEKYDSSPEPPAGFRIRFKRDELQLVVALANTIVDKPLNLLEACAGADGGAGAGHCRQPPRAGERRAGRVLGHGHGGGIGEASVRDVPRRARWCRPRTCRPGLRGAVE